MSEFINKDNIVNYFPYPPLQVIETRGNREGLILKFNTYYLKIYNDCNCNYIIEKYVYNYNRAISIDKVPVSKIREYVSKFSF